MTQNFCFRYWKLRPEPSPEELVSLANLLNMTMEGIQQVTVRQQLNFMMIRDSNTVNIILEVQNFCTDLLLGLSTVCQLN